MQLTQHPSNRWSNCRKFQNTVVAAQHTNNPFCLALQTGDPVSRGSHCYECSCSHWCALHLQQLQSFTACQIKALFCHRPVSRCSHGRDWNLCLSEVCTQHRSPCIYAFPCAQLSVRAVHYRAGLRHFAQWRVFQSVTWIFARREWPLQVNLEMRFSVGSSDLCGMVQWLV